MITEEKKLTEQNEINNNIFTFYQNIFSKQTGFKQNDLTNYLDKIDLPMLSNGQKQICDAIITEKEIYDAAESIENDKTLDNDGLSKDFYEVFWDNVKIPLLVSVNDAFIKEELSTSQKQAIIKIIEKKDRYKRFIKNCRPISLINADLKLISKALATRLKDILPDLISFNQTPYVKSRYMSENGRIIYFVLGTASILNKKGLFVTLDIEKAFDSVEHSSSLAVL